MSQLLFPTCHHPLRKRNLVLTSNSMPPAANLESAIRRWWRTLQASAMPGCVPHCSYSASAVCIGANHDCCGCGGSASRKISRASADVPTFLYCSLCMSCLDPSFRSRRAVCGPECAIADSRHPSNQPTFLLGAAKLRHVLSCPINGKVLVLDKCVATTRYMG